MNLEQILDIIRDEAKEADARAAEACKRSKYSVQDYHLCVEFYLQQLHDRVAREAGVSVRCPIFPMRHKVALLRRSVAIELQLSAQQARAADGTSAAPEAGDTARR